MTGPGDIPLRYRPVTAPSAPRATLLAPRRSHPPSVAAPSARPAWSRPALATVPTPASSTPTACAIRASHHPRLDAVTADLRRRQALVAHTIYACPSCETRYLAERRCPDCHLFCRRLGLGGPCPRCDDLVLVAEILDQEVTL